MRSSFIWLLRDARLWQIALACYWVALFVGTHLPLERVPQLEKMVDKWAHAFAFAVLAGLFATTWELSAGRLNARHLMRVWFILALYGAFEEATQPFVGRYASVWDWLADVVGAALGLLLFVWARRRIARDFG